MLKKIAAAAALAIVASTAAAADAPAIYVGADIGQTKLDDFDERETGYGMFLGYHINETFAIEANYRRLVDEEGNGVSLKANQLGLSMLASLPLSNNFSLYGRLGYNRLDMKVRGLLSYEDDTSGVLYGVGLGYAFSPTVSARLEVQRPDSDVTNVSAGLSFKF